MLFSLKTPPSNKKSFVATINSILFDAVHAESQEPYFDPAHLSEDELCELNLLEEIKENETWRIIPDLSPKQTHIVQKQISSLFDISSFE